MGRVRIQIPADGSIAEAIAGPGPACTRDELRAELERAGVRFGIDEAALAALARRLADPGFDGAMVVARAVAPLPGADGRVECEIDAGLVPGREHDDGRIDFHERERLRPVAAEQLVGHVVAPTAGNDGQDVRGRRLAPRPGRPHSLRLGAGVRVDGDTVLATRGGVLLHDERQLDVVPLYVHAGDVDYRSGNLHTEGSLEVRGDVREGFAATASADIVVSGTVQGGRLDAGGSVQVTAGVLGVGSCVRAGAAIACRHATSARLQAGTEVEIGDHLTQCTVSGERIRLQRGRGAAVGGSLRARQAIRLVDAGAEGGAPTLLAVADLTGEQAEFVRRTNAGARHERDVVRSQRDAGRADGKARRAAMRSGDVARDEKLRLLQQQRELLLLASIEVTGTARAGVRLRFGSHTRQLDEPRTRTRFQWDPNRQEIHEEPMP